MRHVTRYFICGGSVMAMAIALTLATPDRAEARAGYPGSDPSGVTVDLSVLDDLGGTPSLPDLFLGRPGQTAVGSGQRGRLLQADPSRASQSRLLVVPGLMPPASRGPSSMPTTLTPPPALSDLPELVPVPQPDPTASASAEVPAASPAPAADPAASPTPSPAQAEPTAAEPAQPAAQEPVAAPTQTASAPATAPTPPSRPAAPDTTGEAALTLPFDGSQVTLSDGAKASLDSSMATFGDNGAIQVLAYASKDKDNPSKARRTSLSRALAVRTYLIEKGVASNRIDVRALGDQFGTGRADRVDVFHAGS